MHKDWHRFGDLGVIKSDINQQSVNMAAEWLEQATIAEVLQIDSRSHIENEAFMFKHILLATDGSDASEHATQLAVNLARIHGAQLSALYVVDPYPYLSIGEVNPMGFSAYINSAKELAEKAHLHVQQVSAKGGPQVKTQCLFRENLAAAEGIVDTAKECQCDLIIVGSHGRSGLSKLMLGSVASKVVSQSPIPVLVAR